MILEAQIIAINPKGVIVSIQEGPHKGKAYGHLPKRESDKEGNFVDVLYSPSTDSVSWPDA